MAKWRVERTKATCGIADTIWQQIGGMHPVGAYALTGGQCLVRGDDDKTWPVHEPDELGFMPMANSLSWRVNAKAHVKIIITYERGPDLYTVWLWKANPIGSEKIGEFLYFEDGIYSDMLIESVDRLYSRYICQHEDGFIV